MSKILRNNEGITLAEILVVVAIIAIMSGIAVPSFLSWLENKGVQSAARDMYSNFRKAQSTAVKNNKNCAVSFDGVKGYKVYVEGSVPSTNKKYQWDSNEQVIAEVEWSQYRNVQLKSVTFADNDESPAKPTIAFRPTLMPVDKNGGIANGSVTLENTAGKEMKIAISVSGNVALQYGDNW